MSPLKKRRKGVEGALEKKKEKEKQKRQKGTIDLCGYELDARERGRPGSARPLQPDGAVRRHHLPVRQKGHPREHLQHHERALQLLQPGHQRPGHRSPTSPCRPRRSATGRSSQRATPALDDYVEEYNRILNDKMREGVSNLKRQRYLTFTTKADDIDSAIPKLARMRNDCTQALAN